MKQKVIKVLALLFTFVFVLTSCGKTAADNEKSTSGEATQTGTESSGSEQSTESSKSEESTGTAASSGQENSGKENDKTEEITRTVYGELTSIGKYAPAESYSDRALIAVKADGGIFVSWRCYEEDPADIVFTLERNGKTVYTGSSTNYMDAEGKAGDTYRLTASAGISAEGEETKAWDDAYRQFTLQLPAEQKMPDGSVTAYTANDMSVGDLDGDGQLELIVKWYPDNAQDNAYGGYTGTTILDAYDLDISAGTAALMWRIDLGLNIRSGAHYTQFQVWDYDGDGKAELICKTADGSTTFNAKLEETGHVGAVSVKDLPTDVKGTFETYDFRTHTGKSGNGGTLGKIVQGQEYLTVFNGQTGEIIDSVEYLPARGDIDPETGLYLNSNWGKSEGATYANRVDRFLAATAYLDDGSASAVFCRGYYGRSAITAWKLIDGKLVNQWIFDAPNGDKFAGQGNHNLSINDVDGDGYDEIIYGAMAVDNDGTPMYATGLGHGDAMHVSDWNNDGKIEAFVVHEDKSAAYGYDLHDAATGEILWGIKTGKDTGRGMAADVDPRYPGAEMWAESEMYSASGEKIGDSVPSKNFSMYWDGDLLMELFDYNNKDNYNPEVQKWDYENGKTTVLYEAKQSETNNGTKANPCLLADLYGDWREEFIARDKDDRSKIEIYSTNIATDYVFPCLLTNTSYREGVAWQNTAYNQPANLPYLLTEEMSR